MESPFWNRLDVARKVDPVDEPTRPEWRKGDDRSLATKDFRVMDIATAEKISPRALRCKAFKS